MTTPEVVARIMMYVHLFNNTIEEVDQPLLMYSVEAVIDRTLLYLNTKELNREFERVVADVVSGIFNRYKTSQNDQEPNLAVTSVSDNGQSVSYGNEIKNYLMTASDNDLFSGVATILKPYRKVRVLGREN